MKKLPFNFKKISMKHVYICIILFGLLRSLNNIKYIVSAPSTNNVMEILTLKPFNSSSELEVKEIQPIYSESGLTLDVKIQKPSGEETKKYPNVDLITYKIIVEKISAISEIKK